jgi:ABC-type transport system involved in multi-copper enzyme maturation permease subunit
VTNSSFATQSALLYNEPVDFLAVALRELRVASRKRSAFRVRAFASWLALLIAAHTLWFSTLFGGRPSSGEELFSVLSWFAFACACLVGPALTADSINEERNNGTLGLLFLTNLRPTSILLGKLVAHGLLALYAIVAVVPILALAVLLGGADLPSLCKTGIVLVLTLSFALVIGMLASCLCHKAGTAAAVAVLVVAMFVLGIPIAAKLLRLNQASEWAAGLELLSPSYSLLMARHAAAGLSSNRLWLAVAVQALLASLTLCLIILFLPQMRTDGASGAFSRCLKVCRALTFASGEKRAVLRNRLLRLNPVAWLSCRFQWGPVRESLVFGLLALAVFWAGQKLATGSARDEIFTPMIVWIAGLPMLYLFFCMRFAVAASGRFAVDRKSGALELLLCTPMQTRAIIQGHWLGLLRRFWGAAILLLSVHAFALNYIMTAIRLESRMDGFNIPDVLVGSVLHLVGAAMIRNEVAPFYVACLAVSTAAILIVVLWIALGWLAIFLSLKIKRDVLVPWLSLILLALPPVPLFLIAVALLDDKSLFASNLFLAMLRLGASGFSIVLANALLWLFLARAWTYRNLRDFLGKP